MEVDSEVVASVMFPDISMFDSDSEIDDVPKTQPLSPWALSKIGTFQYRLEDLVRTRELRHQKSPAMLRIPTSAILQLANDVFGFNGWSSAILGCTVVAEDFDEENGEFSMKQEAVVEITLQDGTTSRASGLGSCQKLPHKYMCLGYSKKIAITDGLRNAILNLTGMSISKENAIKQESM